MGHGLALARLKQGVFCLIRQIRSIDPRAGARQVAHLAQFFGRHRDLVRSAPAENDDLLGLCVFEQIERMIDDIAAGKLRTLLGQNARDVQRDVAIADDNRVLA